MADGTRIAEKREPDFVLLHFVKERYEAWFEVI
jgi:hypothetical protein